MLAADVAAVSRAGEMPVGARTGPVTGNEVSERGGRVVEVCPDRVCEERAADEW